MPSKRVTIDRLHEIGHQGKLYTASDQQTLADGVSYMWLFQTGSTPLHVHIDASASAAFDLLLFEGTVVSAAGTPIQFINHNRVTKQPLEAAFTDTPTVTADGTQIAFVHIETGQKIGGAITPTNEWILAPDTTYLLRVTSRDTSSVIFWALHVYEAEL